MTYIEHDFQSTPDEILPPEPGQYTLEIDQVEYGLNSKQTGNRFAFTYRIVTEGENEGRTVRDWVSDTAYTRLKQIAKACGLTEDYIKQGFDVEAELLHKRLDAFVGNQTRKDNQTGDDVTFPTIQKYIF